MRDLKLKGMFHKCISEHMGISGSTGKPLSKPPFSNICDHHHSSGHPISPDDFSILSSILSSVQENYKN